MKKRKTFRLTKEGIEHVPATREDIIEFSRQMGLPPIGIRSAEDYAAYEADAEAEAARHNERASKALNEANKLLELSESASTNDIEIYIKDHPPSALAIAFLSQIASSRQSAKIANIRHAKTGGSRDKAKQIRELWASGKYSSRDICAEQEAAALGMSFSAARKALRGTPDPT